MNIVLWGICLAFVGIILLIAGLAQAAQNRSYAACSEKEAVVTHKTSRKTKNGRVYELKVSYSVDGNTYEKWVGVNTSTFETVNVGDEYEILYKPQNPKRAVSPTTVSPRNARIVLIPGAALTVVGVMLCLLSRM